MAIPLNTGRAANLTRNVLAAGRFIPPTATAFSASTAAISANTLYCVPVSVDCNIDALCMAITTGSAGAARIGLYNCGQNGEPTTLFAQVTVDTTNIATVAGTLAGVTRINQPMWLVMVSNATPTVATLSGTTTAAMPMFGTTSMTAAGTAFGFSVSFNYAELPGTFPAGARTGLTTITSVPALAVRTA